MDPRRNYALLELGGRILAVDVRLRTFYRLAFTARRLAGPAAMRILHTAAGLYRRLSLRLRSVDRRSPACLGCLLAAVILLEGAFFQLQHATAPGPLPPPAPRLSPLLPDGRLAGEIRSAARDHLGLEQGIAATPAPCAFIRTRSAAYAAAAVRAAERHHDGYPYPLVARRVTRLVRKAVSRDSVRMPVDKLAYHPLDKASILRAGGERLGRVLAAVASVELPPPPPEPKRKIETAPVGSVVYDPPQAARVEGRLSARFESGTKGVYAIGYDPRGGTSYGKYQFSSRKGTMKTFIEYLRHRRPEWAKRLSRAGPSDTGCRDGSMPREWKRIAASDPKVFERLQDEFVHENFYDPALKEVHANTDLRLEAHDTVLGELLWSTTVQHGPSAGATIFIRASEKASGLTGEHHAKALIDEVFRQRELRLRRIPVELKPVIRKRLRREKTLAMDLLESPQTGGALFRRL
jgi:hypothetical protein